MPESGKPLRVEPSRERGMGGRFTIDSLVEYLSPEDQPLSHPPATGGGSRRRDADLISD